MALSTLARSLPALLATLMMACLTTTRLLAQEEEEISPYAYGILSIERGEFALSGDRLCSDMTIANVGEGVLVIDGVEWSGGGYESRSSHAFPLQLGPGSSRTMSVCRTGTATDLPPDLLRVHSNGRISTSWGLIIDISRSMDTSCSVVWGTRLDIAKRESIRAIDSVVLDIPAESIHDKYVTIAYSGTPRSPLQAIVQLLHPLVSVTDQNREFVKDTIAGLVTIGGTWTGAALREMIDKLEQGPGSMPRKILLLTDGTPSGEDVRQNPAVEIINEAALAGIAIYALNMQAASAADYLDSIANGTGGSQLLIPDCDDKPDLIGDLIRTLYTGQRSTSEMPFPGTTMTLGVGGENRNAGALSMEIAPNPAADQITVTLQGEDLGELVLDIIDAQGRVVLTETTEASARNEIRIATDRLSPGAYTLTARDRSGRSADRRFIIVR